MISSGNRCSYPTKKCCLLLRAPPEHILVVAVLEDAMRNNFPPLLIKKVKDGCLISKPPILAVYLEDFTPWVWGNAIVYN
jgi:hypothetical protein